MGNSGSPTRRGWPRVTFKRIESRVRIVLARVYLSATMAGDSVIPSVTKLKKRIATAKGLFTRTETKIKTLQVKGNESVGNTLLQKLDTYAQDVNDLYDELLDIVDDKDRRNLEDDMNAIDVDHHYRATSCLATISCEEWIISWWLLTINH